MTAGNKLTGGTALFGDIDLVGASTVPKTVKVALTATTGTTGGEVLAWANPENNAIIVTEVVIDVTTQATGAATLNVGSVDTANAAPHADHSVDTLVDGADVGTAAIIVSSNDSTLAGTNGRSVAKLAAGNAAAPGYVSATGSADTAGLVGNAYITYINV